MKMKEFSMKEGRDFCLWCVHTLDNFWQAKHNKSAYLDKNVFLNLDTDVRRWTMILLELRGSPQNVCSLNNMPGSFGRISVIPLRAELAITGADWLACTWHMQVCTRIRWYISVAGQRVYNKQSSNKRSEITPKTSCASWTPYQKTTNFLWSLIFDLAGAWISAKHLPGRAFLTD